MSGFSKDEIVARWSPWFVRLWVVVATALLTSGFVLPFKTWSAATFVGFGGLEAIGLAHRRDRFPPLTYVVRQYLPRWATFTGVYAAVGGLGGLWFGFPHPVHLAALLGLLGWLTSHFEVTYSGG